MSQSVNDQALWLELPPISGESPKRLLVFLHGAGSSAERFAPIAVAWMLKFPQATGAILHALRPHSSGVAGDWFDSRGIAQALEPRVIEAGQQLAPRLEALQRATGVAGSATVLVGFSQGATLALELARTRPDLVGITVSYSGRMIPAPRPGENVLPAVHLLHGADDSVVPALYSERASRRLKASGAHVTLDILKDHGHSIGQDMVILGTTRVLQTIFRNRRRSPAAHGVLH